MMDLRVNDEVRSWFGQEFDLVKRFVAEGGYRLYPEWVKAPRSARGTLRVRYAWRNMGWGYCPVNIPQWNGRYTVGVALLDGEGNAVAKWASDSTVLSEWLQGKAFVYSQEVSLEGVAPGRYTLAVGLVDRKNDLNPGLEVAVDPALKSSGWVCVNSILIK